MPGTLVKVIWPRRLDPTNDVGVVKLYDSFSYRLLVMWLRTGTESWIDPEGVEELSRGLHKEV